MKRKLSPGHHQVSSLNFHNRLHLGNFLWRYKLWVPVSFSRKTAEMCCSKTCSNLDVAMVTKGGQGRLKIYFCFKKWFIYRNISEDLSEKLKSGAQGVLEIIEEVWPGAVGGGANHPIQPPPPPVGIVTLSFARNKFQNLGRWASVNVLQ